jgi:hypothetical protein
MICRNLDCFDGLLGVNFCCRHSNLWLFSVFDRRLIGNMSELDRFNRLIETVQKLHLVDPASARGIERDICRGALLDMEREEVIKDFSVSYVAVTRAILWGILEGRPGDPVAPMVLMQALGIKDDILPVEVTNAGTRGPDNQSNP